MNDMRKVERDVDAREVKISARDCQVWYGDNHAIKDVNVDIEEKTVTAFIGPSGCGKSTFLRCLNRMNDMIDNCRIEGTITLDGQDIYDPRVDPVQLPQVDALDSDLSSVPFELGQSYLVSAGDATIRGCGLSGPDSAQLRALDDAAFGG